MKRQKGAVGQIVLLALVLLILFLVFLPIFYLVIFSFKNNAQIYANFWALPDPWILRNYALGWGAIQKSLLNSISLSLASTVLLVLFAGMAGYAFARHRFPAKEPLYYSFLALMMIPTVLTLIPRYLLVKSLGLVDTPWVLILPWMAGNMAFGILLCRGFFATLSEELFEAGRIDGATEIQLFGYLAIPLSLPILVTLGIVHAFQSYNDYIWPLITINSNDLQVVTVALTTFNSGYGIIDYGPRFAGYLLSAIPLLIMFLFGMRYFIRGLTAGALKA
ncbi:MAG TPA: carbohydrate ABC transporter permease [Chloroflexota bacterium]|nr:carbohydrate ABC transporter permease [Chloroflexota bacterium]